MNRCTVIDKNEISYTAVPISINTPEERKNAVMTVISVLVDIEIEFKNVCGLELFPSNVPYSGSTASLMDPTISDIEFVEFKNSIGDIDVQIKEYHKTLLIAILDGYESKFLGFKVLGYKKHGEEVSFVLSFPNCNPFQIDFECVKYPGSDEEMFLHSSNWEDIKLGFKGLHHKILLNAIATVNRNMKFSITHGLKCRNVNNTLGIKDPKSIGTTLFGWFVNHEDVKSFHGLVRQIKNRVDQHKWKAISDKFKESLLKHNKIDHDSAIEYLEKELCLIHQ